MQNELKQISLRWISIFSDSESKYVKYNKQSDFPSSQRKFQRDSHATSHRRPSTQVSHKPVVIRYIVHGFGSFWLGLRGFGWLWVVLASFG